MKLLNSYPNYTIAQYIIMPYYELDEFWKQHEDKINYKNCLETLGCDRKSNTYCFKYEWISIHYPNELNIYALKHDKNYWSHWYLASQNNITCFDEIINETMCFSNPSYWAIKLIRKYFINENENITDIGLLQLNPNKCVKKIIEKLIEKNNDKISLDLLNANPSKWVYKFLQNNPDKICYRTLELNHSDWAFNIYMKNLNTPLSQSLFANPNVLFEKYFLKYPSQIDYGDLAYNDSDWAFELWKNRIYSDISKTNSLKIFSQQSKTAEQFYRNNTDKINWPFFMNQHIFVINKSISKIYYKLFDKLLYETLKSL